MNAGAMPEAPGGDFSEGELSQNRGMYTRQGFGQIFAVSKGEDRVAVPRFHAACAVATGDGAVA